MRPKNKLISPNSGGDDDNDNDNDGDDGNDDDDDDNDTSNGAAAPRYLIPNRLNYFFLKEC